MGGLSLAIGFENFGSGRFFDWVDNGDWVARFWRRGRLLLAIGLIGFGDWVDCWRWALIVFANGSVRFRDLSIVVNRLMCLRLGRYLMKIRSIGLVIWSISFGDRVGCVSEQFWRLG